MGTDQKKITTSVCLGVQPVAASGNQSTPKRGKASRIDAPVLELAKAAWSSEDLSHFDTRDIIGQLLSVIERQDYEMDCLGQILHDVEASSVGAAGGDTDPLEWFHKTVAGGEPVPAMTTEPCSQCGHVPGVLSETLVSDVDCTSCDDTGIRSFDETYCRCHRGAALATQEGVTLQPPEREGQ